jgi:hypothetical protein
MNVKGFDCNTKLSKATAVKFKKDGWKFAIRYVGRNTMANYDIDGKELDNILSSGMDLGIVQHCPGVPGIIPTIETGKNWGANAREFAKELGYERTCILYLDLEDVNPAYKERQQDIYDYCNYWYDEVVQYYTPGIYIGWHNYLSSMQMYENLKFMHYWKSLSNVPEPAVRGFEMTQHSGGTKFGIQIDIDYVIGDKLGGVPKFMKGKTYNNEELLDKSLANMQKVGITNSMEYWKDKTTEVKFLEELFINTGNYIERKELK